MTEVVDFKDQINKLKVAKDQVKVFEQNLRESAIAHIKDILETAGLSTADLQGGRTRALTRYRDDQGHEWSGVGRAPFWFSFDNIDSFLVSGQTHSAGVINKLAKIKGQTAA